MKDFEQISHTADLQIRVYGTDLKQLFKNALVGMFQVIGPRARGCEQKDGRLICSQLDKQHTIEEKGADWESLLVHFLSDALYYSDAYNEAYLDVNILELKDFSVKAIIYGVSINGFDIEIKAVTYHDLFIKKVHETWQADIVFDI